MIRVALLSTVFVLWSIVAASAADVSGKWKGKIEINGESVNLTYDLKADGDKLTGTAEGPAGKLELENGKIDGDKITFQISFGDNHIQHEGKLADGKIKIVTHMPGGDHEYSIARAVDLGGKWKGEAEFPGGLIMELIYDLKVDGDKLTGSVESPRGKIEIENGKLTDDGFTFTTNRGGTNVKHEAKLDDGKIAITVHTSSGDRKYTLSRVINFVGPWTATFKDDTGNDLPLTFDLKIEGDKLTGTVKSPQGDGEITGGKVSGDEISFDVEFNGNTITHKGKLAGDEIQLKVNGFGTAWDLKLKRPAAK